MYRALVTVVAAAALVFGGAAPATAHASSSVPGAPTSVRVTADSDGAILTWRSPKRGAKVAGWKVSMAAVANRHDRQVDRLHARARSDRFDELTPAATYRFSVRAVGKRGTGRTITLRYTTPPAPAPETTQSLFALDGSGDVVRFSTAGTDEATTVATDGDGFTANGDGDVFTPSVDRTAIVLHPADGGAAETIATGLHLTADLRSDAEGNLYWLDSVSGAVQKLSVRGGAVATVVTFAPSESSATRTLWAVGRDGTVSTYSSTNRGGSVYTASPAGTVTKRTVIAPNGSGLGYLNGLLADGRGTLYVSYQAFGGSGYSGWYAIAAKSTTITLFEPRTAYQYAAVNSTHFSQLQSAEWCPAASEGSPAGCHVDQTLTHLVTRDAAGTLTEHTMSGATANGRGAFVGAADEAGDVFVVIDGGPTPGLWRVGADGGAAEQLSSAQYSRLLVS
ncbi:fibronectin type III domain-containing protein [Curtobacterium sp. VKM Ac-1376]|uniref:fibronectin type III domain-containing protein n=1 Tax=Curtobacterium sp. VKM Ac-1376 TaxID=123312 RepID=UPI00188B23E5|nr:fibronectin type III domain-containing protein [Curtobacterium sp. VKM Ac-1376]MBF4612993.1 fibronectin type III domain-containing protein [Curtobacterium sp. VKM Ac-1376]